MPADLTEDVLGDLEKAVREELAAYPDEYREEAAIMLSLIESARALRSGLDAVKSEREALSRMGWALSTEARATANVSLDNVAAALNRRGGKP